MNSWSSSRAVDLRHFLKRFMIDVQVPQGQAIVRVGPRIVLGVSVMGPPPTGGGAGVVTPGGGFVVVVVLVVLVVVVRGFEVVVACVFEVDVVVDDVLSVVLDDVAGFVVAGLVVVRMAVEVVRVGVETLNVELVLDVVVTVTAVDSVGRLVPPFPG
ncbi:predicted protein [Verticillium alfalfae VaMs.102]|uniref:Predicted protein n=1 Tax=Verticillium alfalfae (strain VaMs.102 / ATCC MYA-4576 / FGSC 10136) TaxID=526221 RepID=C9SAQ8_VERA1|nr:predicted protein [Verticillium alfalfae VaMs.102]EEY16347.1 predicted protein [Verticillium alfalfae VaMs.102]